MRGLLKKYSEFVSASMLAYSKGTKHLLQIWE